MAAVPSKGGSWAEVAPGGLIGMLLGGGGGDDNGRAKSPAEEDVFSDRDLSPRYDQEDFDAFGFGGAPSEGSGSRAGDGGSGDEAHGDGGGEELLSGIESPSPGAAAREPRPEAGEDPRPPPRLAVAKSSAKASGRARPAADGAEATPATTAKSSASATTAKSSGKPPGPAAPAKTEMAAPPGVFGASTAKPAVVGGSAPPLPPPSGAPPAHLGYGYGPPSTGTVWGMPPGAWSVPPTGYGYPPLPGYAVVSGYGVPPGTFTLPPAAQPPGGSAGSGRSRSRRRRRSSAGPKTPEDALNLAEKRMVGRRPTEEQIALVGRFVEDQRLCSEVDLGLRLLSADQARKLVSAPELRRSLQAASDPQEVAISAVERIDAEVGAIIRVLRGRAQGERHHKHRHSRHHSGSAADVSTGADKQRRSGSRRRRRQEEESIRAASRSAPAAPAAAPVAASRAQAPAAPSATGRFQEHGRDGGKSREGDRERRRVRRSDRRSAPDVASGVWGAGDDVEAPPPGVFSSLSRPSGSHLDGGSPADGPPAVADELVDWLMGLDGGRGSLSQYLEPLQREFGDLAALAATVLPEPTSASVVGHIEPSLWTALGVEALGHKLTLAKGIVALYRQLYG